MTKDDERKFREWQRECDELFEALHPFVAASDDPLVVLEVMTRYLGILLGSYPQEHTRRVLLANVTGRLKQLIRAVQLDDVIIMEVYRGPK